MHRVRTADLKLSCQRVHLSGAHRRSLCPHASLNKSAVNVKTPNSLPAVSLSLLEDGPQTAELITVRLPVSRTVAPTPSAVPVVHSKAYYIQHNQFKAEEADLQAVRAELKRPPSGNVFETAIRSFDEQLDEIERNPPPVQKAIFAVSQGPVGQATAHGVNAAAKLTMQATMEAVRLATPVGGWVLKQGAKTAFNWMTYALTKEQQQSSTVKIQKQGRRQTRR